MNLVQENEDEEEVAVSKIVLWARKLGTFYQDWKPARSYAVKAWNFNVEHWMDSEKKKNQNDKEKKNQKEQDNNEKHSNSLLAITVNVKSIKPASNKSSCCSFQSLEYELPVAVPNVTTTNDIMQLLIQQKKTTDSGDLTLDTSHNYYFKHNGWPLNMNDALLHQDVEENDSLILLKKGTMHGCYNVTYQYMNKFYAYLQSTFLAVALYFDKAAGAAGAEATSTTVLPEWYWNGTTGLMTFGVILVVRSFFHHSLTKWQWSVVVPLVVGWLYTGIHLFQLQTNHQVSIVQYCKKYISRIIYNRLIRMYVNLPFVAFSLHFMSPAILIAAYLYTNVDYITNSVYLPLNNAIQPIMAARSTILSQRQLLMSNSDGGNMKVVHFLQSNRTIEMAQQTLDEHAASVVGAAADVNTVFQMLMTGMLSDGCKLCILKVVVVVVVPKKFLT